MMEDSTLHLHYVYNTPWALPCTVLTRSCQESILRSLGVADSELRSDASESRLELDPAHLLGPTDGCDTCSLYYTHNYVALRMIGLHSKPHYR